MSTQENKAVVRRWYEEINKGKEAALASLDELFAPDLVWHGAGLFADTDLAGMTPLITALFTGFPDLHWVVEDMIAEGDKVVVRLTVRGTHQGEFMGIPPTGKQATWTGIEISRIEEHKFVEGWDSFDNLGLLQQLGAIPPMAQDGA